MKTNFKLNIDVPALFSCVLHEVNSIDRQQKLLDKAITIIKNSLVAEEEINREIATIEEIKKLEEYSVLFEKRLAEYPENNPILIISIYTINRLEYQLMFTVKRGTLKEFETYDNEKTPGAHENNTFYLLKCKNKRAAVFSHLFSKLGWETSETTIRYSSLYDAGGDYDHTHYLFLQRLGIILKAKLLTSESDSY